MKEVEQEKTLDHDLWCGKTYPEPSAQTKVQTSEQSYKKQSVLSAKKPPLFLYLKMGGPQQAALPLTGGGLGTQWSVAWRVFDAQFWGVPQRRRRIALVADFGGFTAPEILFEREGVSGYYPQGRTPWERAATDTQRSIGKASSAVDHTYCIQGNCIDRADTAGCNGKGWTEGVSYTLNTVDRPAVCSSEPIVFEPGASTRVGGHIWQDGKAPSLRANSGDNQPAIAIENHPQDSRVKLSENNIVQTLNGKMGTGGGNTPMILEKAPCAWDGSQISPTLTANNAGGNQRMPDKGNFNSVIALDRAAFNQGANAQYDFRIDENGVNSTLVAKGPSAVVAAVDCTHADDVVRITDTASAMQARDFKGGKAVMNSKIIRRLTPLECERLQGFPDGWTDIDSYTDDKGKSRKATDSNRYKALGNSIAIPPWFYVLAKLSLCCGADVTMASLFDGIGGFPLIWETINGEGQCLWASEIENFPIAVTQIHFPDKE